MADKPTRRRWSWKAVGIAALLAFAGLAVWWALGRRFYTDDNVILVSGSEANIRQYLWTPPQELEDHAKGCQEYEPSISPDGSELFFVSGKPGENADIFVCQRRNGHWSAPSPLKGINSRYDELGPCLSPDGQYLLFYSNRPGGVGLYDLWAAARTPDGFAAPFNLGPSVNSPYNEYSPALTPDGRRLFFASNRKAAARSGSGGWRATIRQGQIGDYDIYVARAVDPATTRPASRAPTTRPSGLFFAAAGELDGVNTPYHEGSCAVSPMGDFLYFASNRPGGAGGFDLFRVRLRPDAEPGGALLGGAVENLGAPVNTPANETDPHLAEGGFRLVFSSDRDGHDLYRLFTSESHEVYALRQRRALPAIGWSWWVLLVALPLLILLALLFKRIDQRKLSLLQKCILVSLLIHLLLMVILSFTQVTRQIVAYVRQSAGERMTVDLSSAREAAITLQVRNQVTDMQVPAAAPAELQRIQVPDARAQATKPIEADLPHVERRPPAMQLRALAMQSTPPTVQPQRPAPNAAVRPTELVVDLKAAPPVHANDPTLPDPAQPATITPQSTSADVDRPAPVTPELLRAAPNSRSLAQAASLAPAQPSTPKAIVPQPTVAPSLRPIATAAPIKVALVKANEPDAPEIATAATELQPQQAPTPAEQPAAVNITVPGIASSARSLAQSTPIEARPVPTTRPVAPAVAVNAEPVSVAAPEPVQVPRPVAPVSDLPKVPAVGAALQAQETPLPVSGPGAIDMAVPAVAPAPASLAQTPALESHPLPALAQVAPDAVAHAAAVDVAAPAERTPVAGVQRPQMPELPSPAPAALVSGRVDIAAAPAIQPQDISAPLRPLEPTALPGVAVAPELILPPSPLTPDVLRPAASAVPAWIDPAGVAPPDHLAQRSVENRQRLLKELGGTPESEKAVSAALAYLARQQEPDGRWTLVEDGDRPARRQRDKHDSALTALATLAFLANDQTPAKAGPYRQTVRKALDRLVALQRPNGDLRGGGDMYDQAVATTALAEAATMTGDAGYREVAIQGARFIVASIDRRTGGWRYTPGQAGDTSVLGWQLIALKSVQRLGVPIPDQTRKDVLRFLRSVSSGRHGMMAAYQPGRPATYPMTAEAAFCRIVLGEQFTEEQTRDICQYLLSNVPGRGDEDFYYWYYASLTLQQLHNDSWQQWNGRMWKTLVKLQRHGGSVDGSWGYDRSSHGNRSGRIYSTAIVALTLQVYYRYLPMYGHPAGPSEPAR